MQMPDVNVLVYAHREEASGHSRYARWLSNLATGAEPFALSELVLHGFLRVVTNARIFEPPSSLTEGLRFLDGLIARPGCRVLRPGPDHWTIFRGLCEGGRLKEKIIADAAHAAVAIESGCEWVTADTDFARFAPGLRWIHL
jgi:toxin-antitoxin system PIN domain toxin